MSLLAMAIFDTVKNGRSKYTSAALESIWNTVDWDRHRLVCVDNGSCDDTKSVLMYWSRLIPEMEVITNQENIGQAAGINQAWKMFVPEDRHLARVDNDILFRTEGWLDRLEECVAADPKIGVIGLKHKELLDNPDATDWQKTSLHLLPHKRGERWLVVEKMRHVLGSVQLINRDLFDAIGYLRQFGLWGYEDSDYAVRCDMSGHYSCVYHGAEFDDMDKIKDATYQSWKDHTAQAWSKVYDEAIADYKSGARSLYCEAECI